MTVGMVGTTTTALLLHARMDITTIIRIPARRMGITVRHGFIAASFSARVRGTDMAGAGRTAGTDVAAGDAADGAMLAGIAAAGADVAATDIGAATGVGVTAVAVMAADAPMRVADTAAVVDMLAVAADSTVVEAADSTVVEAAGSTVAVVVMAAVGIANPSAT